VDSTRPLVLVTSTVILVLLSSVWIVGGAAVAATAPTGETVIGISGETAPARMPRSQVVPTTLRLGFTSRLINQATTPELTRIAIEISRDVRFQTMGLPSCSLATLLSTYTDARQACAGSVVGHGLITSEVTLPGQAPVTITGRLLAFYDLAESQPRILAQVTSGAPLPLTYVMPFKIAKAQAPFATSLLVPQMSHLQGECARAHPDCFEDPYTLKGVYGHISNFELSLHRLFAHNGKRVSFVSAECPLPANRSAARYPLAKVALDYSTGVKVSRVLTRRCRVSG
jgi:hypothetical protein